jgi:hypothetical protein
MKSQSTMDMCEALLKKNKKHWLSAKHIACYYQINYARVCNALEGLEKRKIIEKRRGPRLDDLSLFAYRWVDA